MGENNLDKKQLIMHEALMLFAQNTYHGTSINQIAKKVGVSKSLIYNYFQSKDSMLSEIVIKEFVGLFSLYNIDIENINDESFANFVFQTFDLLDTKPSFWKLLFRLMLQQGVMEVVAPQVMELLSPLMKGFVKYFTSKGFLNPVAETQFFWALMDGLSIDYLTMNIDKDYCINKIKEIYKLKI